MSLTRKQLKAWQLPTDMIERIIAAHAETVDGLKAERDALRDAANQANTLAAERDTLRAQVEQLSSVQADLEQTRAELDACRTRAEEERLCAQRQEALNAALRDAGANEKALPLLARLLNPAELHLENGCLKNADALIAPLREQYAAFFAKPVRLPAQTITPPIQAGGALTREDIGRMSADEINRNWNAVKGVLSKGAM